MASAIAVKLGDAAWRQAHEELVRLATERAGLDFEEGRWLLRAHRAGAHLRLGYASFHAYAERLFGYGPASLRKSFVSPKPSKSSPKPLAASKSAPSASRSRVN